MGAGNFCMRDLEDFSDYVYIDIYQEEAEEELEAEIWYMELKENIINLLPDSFYQEDNKWIYKDVLILASNALLDVFIADNNHSIAVGVCVNDEAINGSLRGLAMRQLRILTKNLFNTLDDMYALYVRTSSYTSTKYSRME